MWKIAFRIEESQADRSIGEKKPKLSGEDRPSITELSGYSFKREEFDVEYDNDAELVLADMEFKDTDTEAEHQMKLHVLHIYSKRYNRLPTIFWSKKESFSLFCIKQNHIGFIKLFLSCTLGRNCSCQFYVIIKLFLYFYFHIYHNETLCLYKKDHDIIMFVQI